MANAQAVVTIAAGAASSVVVGSTPAGEQALFDIAVFDVARFGSGVAVSTITVSD